MRRPTRQTDTQNRFRNFAQCIALLLVVTLVSIEPLEASSDDSGHVTMNEVTAGEILLETATPGRYLPAMQLESRATIAVSGYVATVEVVQRFRNATRNWAEGVYVFPLPETAAVNAMELRIGERVIVGKIREKQQARREYQQAKREGRKAGLVEQRRPNMFTTAVANIAPGQEIEVRLTYVEKVAYDGGRFSLRFPMTITPRYIPGAPLPAGEKPIATAPGSGWATNTDQVADASEITPYLDPRAPTGAEPINPIELSVALAPGLPLADISSAYHDIHIVRQGDLYEVSLTAGRVPMGRDFELAWQPAIGSEPAAALFTQELDGNVYALAMILPPVQQADAARLPRETIFIIDKSGSMGGEPVRQARAALELALSRLAPGDRFDIIAFNDRPTSLFGGSRPVDGNTLSEARRFVQRLSASGGTEMMSALNLAFAGDPENTSGLLRQVVFITDGAVGNDDALFKAISDGLADRRLFTVGIGSAPNSHFMRKAAQFGRGTFTYIGKPTEVEQKMDELFARLEKPMLRNVVLDWPDAGAVVEPDPIPDLYDGQPIIVTARLDRMSGELRATGEAASGRWEQMLSLNTAAGHSGIATVWARDRIAGIEDRIALEGESEALRKRILDLALNHQLVSRFTSFVAVEKKISRPKDLPGKSHNVPNLRPAGQSPQPFAYPQTATSATEAFWLGLLGMIAALLLWLRVYNLPQAGAQGREN